MTFPIEHRWRPAPMTSPSIPRTLREQVKLRANSRCEYRRTSEWLSSIEGEIDHIVPRSQGGASSSENLCLACTSCNGYKQAKTSGVDPETGETVALFHPRRQRWKEHFTWSNDATRIVGSTACGRATVEALRLNHPLAISARAIWARTGYHPPSEDEDMP